MYLWPCLITVGLIIVNVKFILEQWLSNLDACLPVGKLKVGEERDMRQRRSGRRGWIHSLQMLAPHISPVYDIWTQPRSVLRYRLTNTINVHDLDPFLSYRLIDNKWT